MTEWICALVAWTVGWAHTPAGPWALFWLAVAESSVFPVPPDLLLIALALLEPRHSLPLAALCTIGSTLGGIVGYGMGRWGGRPLLNRFVSARTLLMMERQFQRYGVWAVAVAGFTPIPYKVFTIGSGVLRLRVGPFVLASVLSRGARFFLVATCILLFGEQARALIRQYLEPLTIALALLVIGGFVALRWMARLGGARPSPDVGCGKSPAPGSTAATVA
jgi:undecaprenyl-diphosphatase